MATRKKADDPAKGESLVNTAEVVKEEHDARIEQNERTQVAAQAASLTFGSGGADPDKGQSEEETEKRVAEREKAAGNILSDGPKAFTTDHFVASVTEVSGVPILSLALRGWVGPAGFSTHAGNIDEVIEALNGLK